MNVAVQPVPEAATLTSRTACVLVDVLRATSTLTVALAGGALRVVPAADPAEAFAWRERNANALLCGERGGRKVQGFDLGNSPFEYEPARVRGRALVFASTNGSRAMLAAQRARRRVLGAFVNASAVVEAMSQEPHVTIVCAGKLGRPAMEDLACAGWLVRCWSDGGATADGAGARLALTLAPRDETEAEALVAHCAHARELLDLGGDYVRDVALCGTVDRVPYAFEI